MIISLTVFNDVLIQGSFIRSVGASFVWRIILFSCEVEKKNHSNFSPQNT